MNIDRYICVSCSRVYNSGREQDPYRERGYGVCPQCQESVARQMVANGHGGATYTLLQARARLTKFA